ncbi:MAG: hypothetical protein LBL09_01150 [Oscillospiraceae bacterium]|jgi:hypothetical protein|nr:hypothetical protein [Oscillospiraceae bacterium]
MSIILRSDRLEAAIDLPGQGLNTTVRFDRAGFITEVTLDGVHTFCRREPDNLDHPCTGGVGLCSEYRLEEAYADAEAGELFLKPGVGLLRKQDDGPYRHFVRYPCEPLTVEYQFDVHQAEFVTLPAPHNGFALRHKKVISLEGNTLSMRMEVSNEGEKPVYLTEYCHNFISLGRPTGPDYRLAFPGGINGYEPSPYANGEIAKLDNALYSFNAYSQRASMWMIPGGAVRQDTGFLWQLSHTQSPLSVTEADSFHPAAIALWAIDDIISPEICHSFSLDIGKTRTWERKWTFCVS